MLPARWRPTIIRAAANLIKETDASLVRFENVNNAIGAGYTERLATNGEEHLLCQNCSPACQGLNPQDPSSLVYAINVKGHPPILLGAMCRQLPGCPAGAHLLRMRELTELKRRCDAVDVLLADHCLYRLEADPRWIDHTAARLDLLARAVRQ